ncbi:DegT/DnrJ/EryC1/StrS family aminotransferase [Frondihabitans australicus]|uniref:Perosamine synthetase n=1 Tax=Frondihabitans australicus TaxID=386892 RepID=A0A495IKH9_9MICO|nr:DegT/DnrJ/EryC1/StrS family aminotransferase [Frondihabitans australicus]RKR75646.1 perosamine synthetase [Frondihabitans australicus]
MSTVDVQRVALAQPDLEGNELKYVTECLETGWISSIGRFISQFEMDFSRLAGTTHAVATNNGTTALHLALAALGVGPGDEVIVPTVTYVATANAVLYCGATPVLVDVMPGTLNIDPVAFEAAVTERTRGVISVHLYGIPADVVAIGDICERHGLFHVEDAAESHGATVGGRPVGSFGDAAIFSFFGNKIVTTGEGGVVTSNNDELTDRLRLLRGQGMDPSRRYWFPVVGYNYRMTNIQAAIGVAQLERFDEMLGKRRAIEDRYRAGLADLGEFVEVPEAPDGSRSVPWLQNVFLRDGDAARRDAVMTGLSAKGVDSRPVFYPMHVLPAFLSDAAFPVADDWSARGISLPLHTGLSLADVDRVCETLGAVASTR